MKTPKKYSNFRFREIVEEFVHSDRDRAILVEKLCNKKTMEQIAEIFDMSVTQVKRIVTREGITVFDIMAEETPKKD